MSEQDLSLWKGNNPPIVWRFLNEDTSLYDLAGSTLVLTVFLRRIVRIEKNSDDEAANFSVDVSTAKLTWVPSLTDIRALPNGRVAQYELEQWKNGVQQTLRNGYLVISGGQNVDV